MGAATGLVCGLNVGSSAESSERSLEPRLPRALAIKRAKRKMRKNEKCELFNKSDTNTEFFY